MWTLTNPLFLWALSAAAVPLILHLLRNRRTTTVPFSTLRFLKQAQHRSSRRVRMENFLLWLLRTLLMILLALAFTIPVVRTTSFGQFLGRANRDVAIVWDVSTSMSYRSGRATVWDRSMEVVQAIIDGLARGDRVSLFLAHDDVTPLVDSPSPDLAAVVAQVKAQKPGTSPSRLLPAVRAALRALKEGGRLEREVHIVTDGQALPWLDFSTKTTAGGGPQTLEPWNASEVEGRTPFFVTLLGAPEPENTCPASIDIMPPLIMEQTPARLSAVVQRVGADHESSLSLVIDGDEVARRAMTLQPGQPNRALFNLPPLAEGVHIGRVETPEDALMDDNAFHFLVHVKKRLPVLCAGSDQDTFFLMRALQPAGVEQAALEVKRVEAAALATENLRGYACVFLCNAIPLPGDALLAAESYVNAGGLLAIFPGDAARPADYANWRVLPGAPEGPRETADDDRRRTLAVAAPGDPVLESLQLRPGVVPIVTVRRHLVWPALHEEAKAILTMGENAPFLVARNTGAGRVIMFAVSADRRWSDYPLSPFFLPIAHQLCRASASLGRATTCLTVGRDVPLDDLLPPSDSGADIRDPAGKAVSVRTVRGDNRFSVMAERLALPGIYTTSAGGADAPLLAANLDPRESDLTPTTDTAIAEMLGVKHLQIASDKADLLKRIEEHRIGRSLVEPLLWIAAALALAELFLANRRCRAPPSLTDQIAIDASGKVHERHAPARAAAAAEKAAA